MHPALRAAAAALVLAIGVAGVAPAPSQAALPTSLSLFHASGFTYQDPNPYACTSTSVQDMLNFVALHKLGGTGFAWRLSNSPVTRDSILAWSRRNDTLAGGHGSDPHGWRNALNAFGWGRAALLHGSKVYEDLSFGVYDNAVKASVRAIIAHRKPVGILAWAGKHAQMIVGYYGLSGDPFAKDAAGKFTNKFTVAGFYLADPLRSQRMVNVKISYAALKSSTNLKLRFRPYLETDSPYDDPYTPGIRAAKDEWYGRFVIVAPIR
jgi:hypothetical protein